MTGLCVGDGGSVVDGKKVGRRWTSLWKIDPHLAVEAIKVVHSRKG
jgi:hypothetical protein